MIRIDFSFNNKFCCLKKILEILKTKRQNEFKLPFNYKSKKMYKTITVIILILGVGFSAMCQTGKPNSARHHVVMEITSNDTLAWKGLMNNIDHIKEIWGDSVQVEVVAHGPGIEILVKAKTTQQIKMAVLKKAGVTFEACNNSMKARKLNPGDLVAEAAIVPSGVGEVILKQEQGWSYLKSGF
jgi:uncharacterized protein